jgi:DNA-binding NarL/FixJ family response regulator
MKDIRVAIFEDNSQLREGLFKLVEASEGFTCVGAFANGEDILRQTTSTRPDVILMDIEMPVVNGIEAVKIVRENFPDIKILMETIFEDDEKIFQSICNGAQGYILKSTAPEEIMNSIREIYEGGAPMTPVIASKVLRIFKNRMTASPDTENDFSLTTREKEILKYLVDGMSYKLIADKCFISVDTVNGHIKNIYKKLQVHSKSEAVVKAIKKNIV